MMDLKLDDLIAFLHICQAGTFTKAAKLHGFTQSALSQKVARLEETLQTTLLIRNPRSLALTSSGEKLLSYAKEVSQRQSEFLQGFDQYQSELSGNIRVAGYGSVMRSLIIPKLAAFLRAHPKVSIEFTSFEMHELESKLKSHQADFILTDYIPTSTGIEFTQIAEEEYVIIRAKKFKSISNTFLDNGINDNATESYFKFINKKIDYKRAFMGDIYAIIDGVAQGLGMAVMSKHLIISDKRFDIVKQKKRFIRPVVLSFNQQSYYTPLHQKILKLLERDL